MARFYIEPKETEPGDVSKVAKERLANLVQSRKDLGEHNFQTWPIYAPGTGRPKPSPVDFGSEGKIDPILPNYYAPPDLKRVKQLDDLEDRMRLIRAGWQGEPES